VTLGTNASSQAVVVKRDVGSTHGYDDRLQAIAVARISRAEHSVVVQDRKGRWHALETTAAFETGSVPDRRRAANHRGSPVIQEVHGLPSYSQINAARQKVEGLEEKYKELEFIKQHGPEKKIPETLQYHLSGELKRANLTWQSMVLGVPETEINQIAFDTDRVHGKININSEKKDVRGHTGPVQGQPAGFHIGQRKAVEINRREFDKSDIAASGVLFHEVSHLKDHELAQKWARTYEQETRRPFVPVGKAIEPFMYWMYAQADAKRLSHADAQLIVDQATNSIATTEARANIRTFLLLLQSGEPDEAVSHLTGYASGLKRVGGYPSPAGNSAVQAEVEQELRTAYKRMPNSMKKDFDAAFAAARKENPDAWVSKLKF
jgi:hypothetical protein